MDIWYCKVKAILRVDTIRRRGGSAGWTDIIACLTAPSQPHGLINSHFVLGFRVACDYFIVSQAKEYFRMLPGEIQDFEFGF